MSERASESSTSGLSTELRAVMDHLPTGVTVVSTRGADGAPLGTTVKTVSSVSHDPPSLMVVLEQGSDTLAGLLSSGEFVVNVLSEHQRAISSRFTGRGEATKATGLDLIGEEGAAPHLAGAIAHLRCGVDRVVEIGERSMVVGEVKSLRTANPNARPLLYFRGHYSRLEEEGALPVDEDTDALPALAVVAERLGLDAKPTVAIVGGGFSGAMTAAHLLRRRFPEGLRIVLVERRPRVGRGIAYSTRWLAHRLNVPAAQMSAYPDDPGHFLRWVRRRDPSVGAGSFVPRFMFGDYVEETLGAAVREADGSVWLERLQDEAVTLEALDVPAGRLRLGLASGGEVRADRVVLATGNSLPVVPEWATEELRETGRYVHDPWDSGLIGAEEAEPGPIALIGTGLTMIDVALTLGAAGDGAPLRAISRNGLLPRAHLDAQWGAPAPNPDGWPAELGQLVPEILVEAAAAADRGEDWRVVVDCLRPVTNIIWRGLEIEQQRFFVERLSRLWEIHRHRMAPEVAMALAAMRRSGKLQITAAEILDAVPRKDGVTLLLRPRGKDFEQHLTAAKVINCSGPSDDVERRRDPFLASVLAAGLGSPHPLGFGLDVDDDGALVDPAGGVSGRLFAVGPLRKGHLWETTAVPELRCQARDLADLLEALTTGVVAGAAAAKSAPAA
ncbi:MAG TPA: FAD-dependent oxidoreductase [Solirubrobacterales bacterium]|nr:FAD-dependent oxidoreductase [Solirubrobacterales bacterium]